MNQAESEARGARFIRVWRGADGRVTRTGELPPDAEADLRAWVRGRAAFAQANAPESDDTGIDVAGIDAFLAAKGLPGAPSVIMKRSAASAYRDVLADRGYTFFVLDTMLEWDRYHRLGAYFREIGMTLSLRAAGPVADAYMHPHLVHEKAHASSLPAEFAVELAGTRPAPGGGGARSWGVHMPRGGHAVLTTPGTSAGEFLEEGFAELMAAEYTRNLLGMPGGLWPEGRPLPAEIDGEPVPPQLATLPAGYVWQSENELPIWASAAFAAAGVELLIQARPSLYEALIRARSEVSGLRDAARLVGEVHPGLYRRLRRAPYSNEGFAAALDDVRDIL